MSVKSSPGVAIPTSAASQSVNRQAFQFLDLPQEIKFRIFEDLSEDPPDTTTGLILTLENGTRHEMVLVLGPKNFSHTGCWLCGEREPCRFTIPLSPQVVRRKARVLLCQAVSQVCKAIRNDILEYRRGVLAQTKESLHDVRHIITGLASAALTASLASVPVTTNVLPFWQRPSTVLMHFQGINREYDGPPLGICQDEFDGIHAQPPNTPKFATYTAVRLSESKLLLHAVGLGRVSALVDNPLYAFRDIFQHPNVSGMTQTWYHKPDTKFNQTDTCLPADLANTDRRPFAMIQTGGALSGVSFELVSIEQLSQQGSKLIMLMDRPGDGDG